MKWQKKNRIMLSCLPEEAQFVMSHDGSVIWRVQWLNPAPQEAGVFETIEAAIIDRQEYLDLRAVLDDGETVPIPEPVIPEPDIELLPEEKSDQEKEQPMTVQQMREMLVEQDMSIQLLTECLLEISEIVYGGV